MEDILTGVLLIQSLPFKKSTGEKCGKYIYFLIHKGHHKRW